MMVRGEPDYIDQVPRRLEYQASHPHVEIRYFGPHWQAIVHEETGETVITRYGLRQLLDKLESLDAEGMAKSGVSQDLPTRATRAPSASR